jgi:hypothetical protein
MTLIAPAGELGPEEAADLAAKYGSGAAGGAAAAARGPPLAQAIGAKTRTARRAPPPHAVERFLSSVADYEACIPGLPPGGAAPPPSAASPAASAALLRLAAASPALAPPLAGGRALIGLIHAQRVLPTGCDAIDDLVHVGLRESTVTEVAGETASGKTQLCLQAAAMRALHGERVLYADTTNGFSAARVARLCEAQHAALAAEAGGGPEVRAGGRARSGLVGKCGVGLCVGRNALFGAALSAAPCLLRG